MPCMPFTKILKLGMFTPTCDNATCDKTDKGVSHLQTDTEEEGLSILASA